MSWKDNVTKVAEGTATRAEFVDAITRWLYNENLAGSTEGAYEALSRRVVWVFPNKYAFVIGTGFYPALYSLDTELDEEESVIPLPKDSGTSGWEFDPVINGWHYIADPEEISIALILNIVDLLTKENGKPFLLLPWSTTRTESIAENDLEEWLGWYGVEDDDEEREEYIPMYTLATLAMNGELQGKSEWDVVITEEDDGLSEYSDYVKFMKLVKHIEDNDLMIIDLDQHCAGCSHGTYEYAVKYNPKLEGKSIFRTWGQNSEYMYLGDGSLNITVDFYDGPDIEKQIKLIAEDLGIYTGVNEDDWEPTGVLEIGEW
jgi:hypothetical protein